MPVLAAEQGGGGSFLVTPNVGLMIWTLIAFGVTLWILWKLAFPRIAEALDRVDVLVAGLGTGGTLMGTGERLRESFPDVVVAAAEPMPGDPVMGLRSLEDGYTPPILDVTKLDRKLLVSNAESVAAVHALLEREGIFAGVSAGAVVHVARRLAAELDEGVVVCVLADGGWKYISASFWDEPQGGDDLDRTIWW